MIKNCEPFVFGPLFAMHRRLAGSSGCGSSIIEAGRNAPWGIYRTREVFVREGPSVNGFPTRAVAFRKV